MAKTTPDRPTRRRFLTTAGVTAGLAAVRAPAASAGLLPPIAPQLPPLPGVTGPTGIVTQVGTLTDPTTAGLGVTINPAAPATPTVIDADVLHRLRRWTYGPTPELLAGVTTPAQAQAYLDRQLDPASIDDGVCEAAVAPFPSNHMDGRNLAANYGPKTEPLLYEACAIKLLRAVLSTRQLQERLTEFWMDHLNVAGLDRFLLHRQHLETTVVRPGALGRFADLLVGVARHPAMLLYLDAASSVREHPNQNYARELLELHTVGIGGTFGEADVQAAARLLTGMTVTDHAYRYDPGLHDPGPVTILGQAFGPRTDETTIVAFLQFLARHPATARRIAARLCVTFVSDEPSPALVDRLARTYLAHDTRISPVLRELFASAEFAGSAGQKLHRPLEHLIATLRAGGLTPDLGAVGAVQGVVAGLLPGSNGLVPGTDVTRYLAALVDGYDETEAAAVLGAVGTDPASLISVLTSGNGNPLPNLALLVMATGQHPGGWGPPNGYPLVGGPYLTSASFYRRLHTTMVAVAGLAPQIRADYPALLGFPQTLTAGALFDRLFRAFLHRPPTDRERELLADGPPADAELNLQQVDALAKQWAPVLAVLPETTRR